MVMANYYTFSYYRITRDTISAKNLSRIVIIVADFSQGLK